MSGDINTEAEVLLATREGLVAALEDRAKLRYALERCRDISQEAQKGGPRTMRRALEQIYNYSSANWITPR